MSSSLYIPPEGIYFRLLGYNSQNVLVSRVTQEPEVTQHPKDSFYEDQLFSLVHGTGNRKGTYAIKGKKSGRVLFSRSTWPKDVNIGHAGGDAKYDDNWFQFEPGTGQYSKQFRLITPCNNLAFVSRTSTKPYVWNHPKSEFYSDQLFSFLFEDMEVEKVEYDLKLGKIMSSTPLVLANQTIHNNSDREQEMSFTLNETATHTSNFQYSSGFTITVGATFKGGVPLVAEAEFSVETSVSNTFTWGTEDSFSKSYTANFPVKAGPRSTVRAISTVNRGNIEVPYTIYLKSKSNGVRVETKGIWTGVSTWDLRHSISNQ